MGQPFEAPHSVTAYTVRDIPDGLWRYYKTYAQGDIRYDVIGEKLIRDIAIEVACRQKHNQGVEELLLEEGFLEETDIEAALTIAPPGNPTQEEDGEENPDSDTHSDSNSNPS